MKELGLTILLFVFSHFSFGQSNFLERGNEELNKNDFIAAEQTFREAIKYDSANLIYQNQLALSLIKQKKHKDAQKILDKILLKDSNNIGALWYAGVNDYLEKSNLRRAIKYFEKVSPLLNETQGQYFSANWFIGKSYEILLQTEGLSYNEVSRMLECYSTYLRLQPNADDVVKISSYVQHIKSIRPPKNVEKWLNVTQ